MLSVPAAACACAEARCGLAPAPTVIPSAWIRSPGPVRRDRGRLSRTLAIAFVIGAENIDECFCDGSRTGPSPAGERLAADALASAPAGGRVTRRLREYADLRPDVNDEQCGRANWFCGVLCVAEGLSGRDQTCHVGGVQPSGRECLRAKEQHGTSPGGGGHHRLASEPRAACWRSKSCQLIRPGASRAASMAVIVC